MVKKITLRHYIFLKNQKCWYKRPIITASPASDIFVNMQPGPPRPVSHAWQAEVDNVMCMQDMFNTILQIMKIKLKKKHSHSLGNWFTDTELDIMCEAQTENCLHGKTDNWFT